MGLLVNAALWLGFLITAAVAVTISILLPSFYREWNPGGRSGYTDLPAIFLVIEPLIVLAGWVAAWAWIRRRWLLAASLLVVTAFGPWGINFVLALVPLGLGALVLLSLIVRRIGRRVRSSQLSS